MLSPFRSDDALCFEFLKLCLVEAQVCAVDGGVVLTQQRGGLARLRLGAGQLLGGSRDMQLADAGLVDFGEHIACAGDLRIDDHTVNGVDGAGRAAGIVEQLVHLVDGVLLRPGGDDLTQRGVIGHTVTDFHKTGIFFQLWLPHYVAEDAEELVVARGHDDAAVLGGEGIVGIGGFVAVADALRETAQYPMILFSGGYYQRTLLESSFRTQELTPEILFHSNQLTTIKSFIRENIASGFIMPQIIHEEDGIIPIEVEEGLRLNVAVVWRKDDYLTKEAKSFISFCRKTFEAT